MKVWFDSSIPMNAPDTVTDRQIRDEAHTPEAEWRAWLDQLAPPPLPDAMLPRAGDRLVIVAPHPDDEVLACGGLMAMHAVRGGTASVIAVTDGEASHRDDGRWPAERLASARRAERALGLARLGVPSSAVTRIGLPDGAVSGCAGALHDTLRRLLRASDVVVTTWALDGHPDHDATGAAVEQVCAEHGCLLLQAPVWMWQWSAPFDPRVPWQRLRAVALPTQARASKANALAEHVTQLSPRAEGMGAVLGASILARATRPAEYFFV